MEQVTPGNDSARGDLSSILAAPLFRHKVILVWYILVVASTAQSPPWNRQRNSWYDYCNSGKYILFYYPRRGNTFLCLFYLYATGRQPETVAAGLF